MAPGGRGWRSRACAWTWRPLARRDAIRNPVYDRYLSINRHANTPDGWIHWQDNTKIATSGDEQRPIVQEYTLNTYTRFDGYNVAAADEYWAKTSGFWVAIRAEWARIAERGNGIRIEEEAETGTVVSGRLLSLANEVAEGAKTQGAAIAEALNLMREATGVPR